MSKGVKNEVKRYYPFCDISWVAFTLWHAYQYMLTNAVYYWFSNNICSWLHFIRYMFAVDFLLLHVAFTASCRIYSLSGHTYFVTSWIRGIYLTVASGHYVSLWIHIICFLVVLRVHFVWLCYILWRYVMKRGKVRLCKLFWRLLYREG